MGDSERSQQHRNSPRSRRIGRPPASDAAGTRAVILVAARETFAELGFAQTTNRHIATKAGVTSGALYHYFDSKVALLAAVHAHVQSLVYERLEAAVSRSTTFFGKVRELLEEAHRMNDEDPSLARFLASARIDAARLDELKDALATSTDRSRFLTDLVDYGVGSGEVREGDAPAVRAFLRAMLTGLTDAVSHDQHQHRLAIDGFWAVRSQ